MIPPENNKEDAKSNLIMDGQVIEALPNTLFKVKLTDDKELLCYLAGKMRINKIRVLLGDNVTVQLDPYGGRGRIIKRL